MTTIDYDKELTAEQYESEEYRIGFANGVCNVLGLIQRKKELGYSIDQIIEEVLKKHNDIFQIEEYKNN